MKKYTLLKHSLYSSVGGYDEDSEIVMVDNDRKKIEKYVKSLLEEENIEEINDMPVDEFEFKSKESMWKVNYEIEGMTILDECTYKIVEENIEVNIFSRLEETILNTIKYVFDSSI